MTASSEGWAQAERNAAYIATVGPRVGQVVAEWLLREAVLATPGRWAWMGVGRGRRPSAEALATAREVLRGGPDE